MGTSLDFLGQNLVVSSNINSVRSGRNIELRGLTPVSIGSCNSRLWAPSIVFSADLESKANSGSCRVLLVMFGYFLVGLTGQFRFGRVKPHKSGPT